VGASVPATVLGQMDAAQAVYRIGLFKQPKNHDTELKGTN